MLKNKAIRLMFQNCWTLMLCEFCKCLKGNSLPPWYEDILSGVTIQPWISEHRRWNLIEVSLPNSNKAWHWSWYIFREFSSGYRIPCQGNQEWEMIHEIAILWHPDCTLRASDPKKLMPLSLSCVSTLSTSTKMETMLAIKSHLGLNFGSMFGEVHKLTKIEIQFWYSRIASDLLARYIWEKGLRNLNS